MVDSRWAMANVVRPAISGTNADWISRSDWVSSAEVASSKIKMRGFFKMARAIATRCFSPPDSL